MKTNATKSKNPQAKRWVFTLNNPEESCIQWNATTMDYLVYGEEIGESGTPHHQGFVIFKNNKRLSQLKELNDRAHYEVARGTNVEASKYCKKDGKVKEFGTLPLDPIAKAQPEGAKANYEKWRTINDKAKEGDLEWIDMTYPKVYNQSYKNLKQMKTDFMKRKPDLDDVCGIWYHGKSGVGKTTLVTKLYPSAYLKRPQNKWFDGYRHEDVIILDDVDVTHEYIGYELKKLADKFCYMVEVKTDSMYIRPKQVVVTSQYTIEEIWKADIKTVQALKRRFKVINVTKENIGMLSQFIKPEEQEKKESQEEVTPEYIDLTDEDALCEEVDAIVRETMESRQQHAKFEAANAKAILKSKMTDRYNKKTASKNPYFPDRFNPIKLERANAFKCEELLSDDDIVEEIEDYDSDEILINECLYPNTEEDFSSDEY